MNSIKLYPQPADDILYIDTPQKIQKIEIYSSTAKLMKSIQNIEKSINIQELKSGAYVARIIFKDQIVSKRFIKF